MLDTNFENWSEDKSYAHLIQEWFLIGVYF